MVMCEVVGAGGQEGATIANRRRVLQAPEQDVQVALVKPESPGYNVASIP